MEYKITLTNAQDLALSYAAFSQQDWIDNAVHTRCSVAIEDIVKICVEKCLENGVQIPGSKDHMVEMAFAQGWVKSSKDSTDQLNQNGLI
jgi:hypothetical protein